MSATGARPSMAMPISLMAKPVSLFQYVQHIIETPGDDRRGRKCFLDRRHVFEAARGDERDHALLVTDRSLLPQSLDGDKRSNGGRLGPNALGLGESRDPLDQRVIVDRNGGPLGSSQHLERLHRALIGADG